MNRRDFITLLGGAAVDGGGAAGPGGSYRGPCLDRSQRN